MNVYKIIDTKTHYCGGMALVAANNEQEAINVFDETTVKHFCYDKNNFECYILETLISTANKPYLITEEWYYE